MVNINGHGIELWNFLTSISHENGGFISKTLKQAKTILPSTQAEIEVFGYFIIMGETT